MERRFARVPGSLNALLVLEAAVRHASFTAAGRELALSQPTVSRHVSTLESRIGQALFRRLNNQLRPTAAGRRLADAVALGLGHVESVWEELSLGGPADDLVLASSFGFADQWLLPRFSLLQQAVGSKRVRLAVSDWMDTLDMGRIDVAVVHDLSHAPDRPSIPLFAEEAFPVCSPDYLRRHPALETGPEALGAEDLLHFDVGESGFLTWETWFTRCNLPMPRCRQANLYNAYPFLLRAAQDGDGVALGWRYLVERMIDDGSLVRIGPSVRNRDHAYYCQYRATGPQKAAIDLLVKWFRDAVAAEPDR